MEEEASSQEPQKILGAGNGEGTPSPWPPHLHTQPHLDSALEAVLDIRLTELLAEKTCTLCCHCLWEFVTAAAGTRLTRGLAFSVQVCSYHSQGPGGTLL